MFESLNEPVDVLTAFLNGRMRPLLSQTASFMNTFPNDPIARMPPAGR